METEAAKIIAGAITDGLGRVCASMLGLGLVFVGMTVLKLIISIIRKRGD